MDKIKTEAFSLTANVKRVTTGLKNSISVFPGGSDGKASVHNAGAGFNPWVRKIPWKRKWQPTPVFLPGKLHGQRHLEGYRHGVPESQMRLSTHKHMHASPSDIRREKRAAESRRARRNPSQVPGWVNDRLASESHRNPTLGVHTPEDPH